MWYNYDIVRAFLISTFYKQGGFVILLSVFENGRPVDSDDVYGDSPYYEPEKALAILVERLRGDTRLESIGTARNGTSKIVIDSQEKRRRFEFQGNEDDMSLLQDVCLLYIQARSHLCSESVKALVK